MPLNFPSNPAVNEQYTFGGRTWIWNGSAWDSYNPGITAYVSAVNGFTGGITLAAGSGITLTGSAKTITISTIVGVGATGPTGPQGNTGATGPVGDYVISFNGATGAISGVNSVNGLTGALSLLASTGIGIAAGGKGITFTNTGVQSFNGLTGAVTGVTQINAGSNITVTGTTNPTIGVTSNPSFRTITGIDGSGDVSSLLTLGTVAQSIPQFAPVISSNAALYLNGTSNSLGLSAGSANFSGGVSCLAGLTVAGNIRVSGNYLGTVTNTVNGTTGAVLISGGNGISITTSGKTSTVTNIGVTSLNGATGTLEDVASLNGLTGIVFVLASTGISVAAGGKGITFTNTGVQSFNGLTGAVTGVTVGGANTFTALNSFNAGISSAGGTFSSLVQFTAGLTASSVYGGTVYTNNIVAQDVVSPVYINDSGAGQITYIGDYSGAGSSTLLTVDDSLNTITLGGSVVNTGGLTRNYTIDGDTRTQTSSTTANQTICSLGVGSVSDPTVFAVEVTIMASDTTLLNKHEIVRMLVTHDFTNTYNTQYGVTRTGTALATYTTTLTGAIDRTLLIRATPTSANLTSFVVMYRTYAR